MRRRLASGSFFQGTSRSTANALATPSMMRAVQPSPRSAAVAHGAIAPSRIESDGSGTTSAGSTSSRLPRPVQAGQAKV